MVNWLLASPLIINGAHRSRLLTRAGMNVRGSRVLKGVTVGSRMVVLKPGAFGNEGRYFDGNERVVIGRAAVAQGVRFVTSTHEIGPSEFRVGALVTQPIHVGDGAWIGAFATILPGVTIGNGAIVAAGSVVTKDVEPNTAHGGVPVRLVRSLEG
ncbi:MULTISPECIES: DapH/DapD/GlmU-related protein [Cryobacterium]|uniref:Acyltransferase n=1 Tax=Cryobacterium breve TaxID=1259258 RepID=A0ABY2J8J4_9MICO|nr:MULTISPECIES: DapH/DapD/GlmU-related protein [Cryobacterium]TFC95160.1 acyltransferase [Cryobacterium sp. TmT3-12]TFD00384.1 acyltransferase [Cryobacterium breve]